MWCFLVKIGLHFLGSTIWIRSERPYRIEISLRMLQQTFFLFGQIHPECFNLAVRKLASVEVESTAGTRMLGNKHFFDLQFHSQARALRHSWMDQETRTAVLIDNVVVQPFPKYDVFNSNIVRDSFLSFILLIILATNMCLFTVVSTTICFGGFFIRTTCTRHGK